MTDPVALTSASVAQAAGGRAAGVTGLTAVLERAPLNGPAFTCECEQGDNLALHRALARAPRGAVLVCDAGGDSSGGYFGELMARDAVNRGVAGLVISGSVRDTEQIRGLGFPVFHHGTQPASCAKRAARSVGETISLLGVTVAPGDGIVADVDGLLVVPAEHWSAVASEARRLDEREAELVERLTGGERLADLLDIPLD